MKRSVAKRLADRKRHMRRRLERANQLKYRRAQEEAGCVLDSTGLGRAKPGYALQLVLSRFCSE